MSSRILARGKRHGTIKRALANAAQQVWIHVNIIDRHFIPSVKVKVLIINVMQSHEDVGTMMFSFITC